MNLNELSGHKKRRILDVLREIDQLTGDESLREALFTGRVNDAYNRLRFAAKRSAASPDLKWELLAADQESSEARLAALAEVAVAAIEKIIRE